MKWSENSSCVMDEFCGNNGCQCQECPPSCCSCCKGESYTGCPLLLCECSEEACRAQRTGKDCGCPSPRCNPSNEEQFCFQGQCQNKDKREGCPFQEIRPVACRGFQSGISYQGSGCSTPDFQQSSSVLGPVNTMMEAAFRNRQGLNQCQNGMPGNIGQSPKYSGVVPPYVSAMGAQGLQSYQVHEYPVMAEAGFYPGAKFQNAFPVASGRQPWRVSRSYNSKLTPGSGRSRLLPPKRSRTHVQYVENECDEDALGGVDDAECYAPLQQQSGRDDYVEDMQACEEMVEGQMPYYCQCPGYDQSTMIVPEPNCPPYGPYPQCPPHFDNTEQGYFLTQPQYNDINSCWEEEDAGMQNFCSPPPSAPCPPQQPIQFCCPPPQQPIQFCSPPPQQPIKFCSPPQPFQNCCCSPPQMTQNSSCPPSTSSCYPSSNCCNCSCPPINNCLGNLFNSSCYCSNPCSPCACCCGSRSNWGGLGGCPMDSPCSSCCWSGNGCGSKSCSGGPPGWSVSGWEIRTFTSCLMGYVCTFQMRKKRTVLRNKMIHEINYENLESTSDTRRSSGREEEITSDDGVNQVDHDQEEYYNGGEDDDENTDATTPRRVASAPMLASKTRRNQISKKAFSDEESL